MDSLNFFVNFDSKVTLFLKEILPHNAFFDSTFKFFSLQGATIFVWIIIFVLAIIVEERKNPGISSRDKKFIISFTLSLLITFVCVNLILKKIIQRPRPKIISNNLNLSAKNINQIEFIPNNLNMLKLLSVNHCPTDFSFPSSHAALSFASAGIIAYFDKKRLWFYYLVAILISYSRIYLGCHYFLDIFFGAILGYLISKTLLK